MSMQTFLGIFQVLIVVLFILALIGTIRAKIHMDRVNKELNELLDKELNKVLVEGHDLVNLIQRVAAERKADIEEEQVMRNAALEMELRKHSRERAASIEERAAALYESDGETDRLEDLAERQVDAVEQLGVKDPGTDKLQ